MALKSGRRLCVLFEAGGARYSIEATSVLEIGAPAADGETLHGVQLLQDLSSLLGGRPEQKPGMALLLDVSPSLAIRVHRIIDVSDVGDLPFLMLPPGLGDSLALIMRGAIVQGDHLYIELAAEMLPNKPFDRRIVPQRRMRFCGDAPERALIFEVAERLFGIPLPFVSQIVPLGDEFWSLPFSIGPVAGLFPHAQTLWPLYSVPGLLGEIPSPEKLIILTDVAGHHLGIGAGRVLGVCGEFAHAGTPGLFRSPGIGDPLLILDLERMFA